MFYSLADIIEQVDKAQAEIGPLADALYGDSDVDPGYGDAADNVKIILDGVMTNLLAIVGDVG